MKIWVSIGIREVFKKSEIFSRNQLIYKSLEKLQEWLMYVIQGLTLTTASLSDNVEVVTVYLWHDV